MTRLTPLLFCLGLWLMSTPIFGQTQPLEPLWLNTINGESYDYSSMGAYIDAEGAVYTGCSWISGRLMGQNNPHDSWSTILLKYARNGEIEWMRNYPTRVNLHLSGVQETAEGDMMYSFMIDEPVDGVFAPLQFGPYRVEDYGVVFLTLDKDGNEKGFLHIPPPVWFTDQFVLSGDTLFMAYSQKAESCDDPYKWNRGKGDPFHCRSLQVKALNRHTGAVYWESEASSGSMFQGVTMAGYENGELLLCGHYYNGDMKWGSLQFQDEWRNNAFILKMDAQSGKIRQGVNFYGDDLEAMPKAVFGNEGRVYTGGFLTGTEIKGPNFTHSKKSEGCDALFLQLDSKLQVTQYTYGWGEYFSRVGDVARGKDDTYWYLGAYADPAWHIDETIYHNPKVEDSWKSNGFLFQMDAKGKFLHKQEFKGSDRIETQRIFTRGPWLLVVGYYEGDWTYEGFSTPVARKTDGFFLMLRTDSAASATDVVASSIDSLEVDLADVNQGANEPVRSDPLDTAAVVVSPLVIGAVSPPEPSASRSDYFDLTLYPVPTMDELTISISGGGKGTVHYQLCDTWGRILKQGAGVGTKFELDCRELAAGKYFVTVWQGGKWNSRGFVKL